MKKYLLGALLILGVMFGSHVFAQEENVDSGEVYVGEITIVTDEVVAGKSIEGNFDIVNTNAYVVSGVRYRVEVAQIFEETISYDYGDGQDIETVTVDQITNAISASELSGPISVAPEETLTTSFSYQIPTTLPEGRLALVIQLYASDDIQADSHFLEIDVSGNRLPYLTVGGVLVVNDEVHGPLEGPTVEAGDMVTVRTVVTHQGAEPVTAYPVLSIFAGNRASGTNIFPNTLAPTNIFSGSVELSYEVPIDLEPGVYTGVLQYTTSTSEPISVPVEFRYIVSGAKPKLGVIGYNTKNLVNDNLLISVSYLDTPINFRKNADGSYKDARMQQYVETHGVFTEENFEIVAERFDESALELPYASNISAVIHVRDFFKGTLLAVEHADFLQSNEVTVDVGRVYNTSQLIVEVELYQDGQQIDTYTDIVPVETYVHKNIFEKLWNLYGSLLVGGVGLIVLMLIVLIIKKIKARNHIIVPTLLALILIGASIVFTEHADAVSTSGFSLDENFVSHIRVNSPKPPNVTIYEPGEALRFTAELNFMYCTNSGYNLHARMSRPVLVGRAPAAMGAWVALGKKKFLTSMYNYAPLGRYESALNLPLRAPNQPGVYSFQYEVVTRSGDWGDVDRGTVRFKVARDVCKNIRGVQERVPRGYVAARNVNGQPICNRVTAASLRCAASKNRLTVGEAVTYTATTQNNIKANFNWYNGREFNSANLVKTQNNTAVSTYTTSYNTPGLYYTTAVAFVGGQSGQCTLQVAVGEEFWDDPLDEDTGEVTEDGVQEMFDGTGDGLDAGDASLIDPTAGPGSITFDLAELLTNTVCKGSWEAQNVYGCYIYKNQEQSEAIDVNGEKDFMPGTYQIKCNQTRDGSEIVSEVRICRASPNFREL